MPSSTITTLVQQLDVIPVDSTAQGNFQDEIIYELARGRFPRVVPPQTGAVFLAVTASTERYTVATASPNFHRTPIAICYDTRQLAQIRKEEAWEYLEAWRRSPRSTVVGFTMDPEDRVSFSVVPPPRRNGDAIGSNTPTSITTWPSGNLTVIATRSDTTFPGSTYSDYQLPIALETLAREFARDSDHQDTTFAQVCRQLAQFFFAMTTPLAQPT